jgi:hypothetical protein
MRAFKLLRKRSNGTLGPLFINRKLVIPLNVWLPAEDWPTRGYAHRPGWHATLQPVAPHLSIKGRIWAEIKIKQYKKYKRPESQGGTWVLANWMKVVRLLPECKDTVNGCIN